MTKILAYFFIMTLLSACSVYSSAGRKQFESKAPAAIQSFSLKGCREMSSAEAWWKNEFPNHEHELIEMHPDYEVWGHVLPQGEIEVLVYSKNANDKTESCIYQFESELSWLDHKNSFLAELPHSLENLD